MTEPDGSRLTPDQMTGQDTAADLPGGGGLALAHTDRPPAADVSLMTVVNELGGPDSPDGRQLLRVTLAGGMSDRTWATYWRALRRIRALRTVGAPFDLDEAHRVAERANGNFNVRKFARAVDAAVASWLASDAGRAWVAANCTGGAR